MRRILYGVTAFLVASLAGSPSVVHPAPKLIWNASASVPIGLYYVHPAPSIESGDLVAVNALEPLASLLAERGYLPRGVPLMKHVVALPGQEVCRIGRGIMVDGVPIGSALERDRFGRSLPVWQGCRRIAYGELFLMNARVRDSFDGRYFGPLPARAVVGRAMPIWTDEDGDGRFEWRASRR